MHTVRLSSIPGILYDPLSITRNDSWVQSYEKALNSQKTDQTKHKTKLLKRKMCFGRKIILLFISLLDFLRLANDGF